MVGEAEKYLYLVGLLFLTSLKCAIRLARPKPSGPKEENARRCLLNKLKVQISPARVRACAQNQPQGTNFGFNVRIRMSDIDSVRYSSSG